MWSLARLRTQFKETPPPSNRKFALSLALIFVAISVISHHRLVWWIAAAGLIMIWLLVPQALLILNQAWHRLGLFLGWLTQPVIFTLIYFLAFTPIALMKKISKKKTEGGTWAEKKNQCHFERTF